MKVETLAQSRFFADNFNDVLGDESRNEKYFFNPRVWLLPGGASRKAGWGYAAHFPTLLPYLWLAKIWEFSYLIYDLTKNTILIHDRYGWRSCPKH